MLSCVTEKRILFLRAINVGGTAKLPMAELRDLAQQLGATEVSTYIASGNLLCVPPDAPAPGHPAPGHTGVSDPQAFDRALEQAIEQRYGFFREVISRTRAQLVEALAAFPFEQGDPRFDYVTFLSGVPTATAVEAARQYETFNDRWMVVADHQFIQYAEGAGKSQMNGVAIARALGVAGTARNLNSVRKLIELAAS